MAFDAGAIEATLTLNRNPFTAGLAAAKSQARKFASDKIEAKLGIKIDQRQLMEVEAKLKRLNGQVAKATAKVMVDRLKFDKLLVDLKKFSGTTYSANLDLDTAKATADAIAFKTLLATITSKTIALSASTKTFGSTAGAAFDGGSSHFQKMALLIIGTLPIIASAFTAAVGAAGALVSTLLIAGLGAGAFALVAVPAFKQVKAAVAGGAAEIAKLPDGLRQAANGLKELLGEYDKLVKANEKITGIALSAWFNAGTAALSTLNPLVKAAANAFGDAGLQAVMFFEGPWWSNFVGFLSGAIGPAVDKLFRSIFAMIQIVGNLTKAFWELGGSQIMEMIASGLEQFALYTEKIGQNKSFQEFMDSAVRSLPVVGKLIGDLLVFILKLATGLEPLGTLIIRVLNGIFDAVNSLPPSVLAALAFGFAAMWAAFALGAGGPIAIAVGVLTGLAVIFAKVWSENERLRAGFDAFATVLKQIFLPIWQLIVDNYNTKIKPAWDDLVNRVNNGIIPALQNFGRVVLDEVVPKLMPFVNTITGTVIPAILAFLGALNNIITFLINTFGPTIARELGAAVTVFDGAFRTIAGLLNVFTGIFTLNWSTFTQGIRQITEGFWTIIAGMWGTNLDGLRNKFHEWDQSLRGAFSGLWTWIEDSAAAAAAEIGRRWRAIGNLFAAPINWVITHVIGPPGGIAGAWNTVMSWIGAPGLADAHGPPQIPAFASGGRVRGPGTSTSDDVPALLSDGEFVVRTDVAKQVYPFLKALNSGQAEAMRAANPNSNVDRMMMRFAGGGLANAQRVANGMVGKPYIWGGAGPGGADCSGLWSIITNAARGAGNPYSRIGTTGSFPWGGFTPGLTSSLSIGNTRARGHMAGTLAGTNYEARQTGTPILSGGAAKGADNGYFDAHYSLPSVGGLFASGGPGGGAPAPPVSWWSIIADKVTSLFTGLFSGSIPGAGGVIGQAMTQIPKLLVEKVLGLIRTKLEGLLTAAGSAIAVTAQGQHDNPLSGFGTTDRGAIIPPGASTVFNATGKPEPLTNLDVYERMKPAGLSVEDVLALIEARRGGGGDGGDTYNVMLPERASVRELADTLDFKRRVVSKGRYSR